MEPLIHAYCAIDCCKRWQFFDFGYSLPSKENWKEMWSSLTNLNVTHKFPSLLKRVVKSGSDYQWHTTFLKSLRAGYVDQWWLQAVMFMIMIHYANPCKSVSDHIFTCGLRPSVCLNFSKLSDIKTYLTRQESSTWTAHSPGRQWLSLDFEVLIRTDGHSVWK